MKRHQLTNSFLSIDFTFLFLILFGFTNTCDLLANVLINNTIKQEQSSSKIESKNEKLDEKNSHFTFRNTQIVNQPKNSPYQANQNGIFKTNLNWQKNRIFEDRVFIENKGQFNHINKAIKYGVIADGVEIYFCSNGLIVKSNIIKQKLKTSKSHKEKEVSDLYSEPYLMYVNWIGANTNSELFADDQIQNYYTYGDEKKFYKANAYEKITYKSIYNGIDIEYTFHKTVGLKYNFILHPGADASQIKMKYVNAESVRVDDIGNLKIKTPNLCLVDHAPETFYKLSHNPIKSSFVVNNSIVSFNIEAFDTTQQIIIDPWLTNPSFNFQNSIYDLDFDNNGNLYATGGPVNQLKLIKLNSNGVVQWVYAGFPWNYTVNNAYGDLAVNEITGDSFVADGWNGSANGAIVMKLNTSGFVVASSTGYGNNMLEIWRLDYNSCANKLVLGGGCVFGDKQVATMDGNLNTIIPPTNAVSAPNAWNDIVLLAIDDYNSSFCYLLPAAGTAGSLAQANKLFKCPISTLLPAAFSIPTGHSFSEIGITFYRRWSPNFGTTSANQNGMNGLAISPEYVYSYDGLNLKKWHKITGALIGNVSVANGVFARCGGVAVDECDNVYVGTKNSIQIYNSSLGLSNSIVLSDTTFDVKIDINKRILYACGKGFVSTHNIPSNTISFNIQQPMGCSLGSATVIPCGNPSNYSYLWSPSSQTTQIANGLWPGTYTVTIVLGCNVVQTATVAIFSGPLTQTVSTIVTNANCNNSMGSVNITNVINGIPSYTLSEGSTTISSNINVPYLISNVTPGIHTYLLTSANGCITTFSVNVLTNGSIPNLTTTTPVSINCSSNTLILNAASTATGSLMYAWVGTGIVSGSNSANPVVNLPGNYTVSVYQGACTNTALVVVNASTIIPNLSVVSSVTLCPTTSIVLTGTSTTSGVTYNWSPQNINTNTTIVNAAGIYTLTAIHPTSGCKTASTINVYQPPPTSLNWSNPITACSGTAAIGSFVLTANTPNISYSFSLNGVTSNPSITSSTPYIIGYLLQSFPIGTNTFIITDNLGCTLTKTFVVNPLPIPSYTLLVNTAACNSSNGSATLIASPIYGYTWSPTGGSAPGGWIPNTSTQTAVSLSPGTHSVTFYNSAFMFPHCPYTATFQIGSIGSPTLTPSFTNAACGNATGSASVSVSPAGTYTYTWSNGQTTALANNLLPGIYTVSVKNSSNCTATQSFTIGSTPSFSINPISPVMLNCNPATQTLNASSTATGSPTYAWTGPGILSGATTSSPVINAAGNYTVTLTQGLCTNSAVVVVNSNTNVPYVSITNVNTLTCLNSSFVAIGASTTSGVSYSWTPLSVTTASALITAAGNYTLDVTHIGSGCKTSSVITVNQNTVLPNITILPTGTLSCLNTSITLTGNSTTSGASFSWSPQGVTTVSALASAAGNYTFTVTDPLNGCISNSIVAVTQNTTSPNLNVNPSTILTCLNPTATLSATSAGNTIVWNGGSLTNATNPVTVNLAGTYSASATDPISGCSTTSIITVSQNTTNPNLNITPATALTCLNPSTTLTAISSGNTILWNGGSLNNATNPATVNLAGTYSVTATDPINGCTTTQTLTVNQNTTSPNVNAGLSQSITCSIPTVTLNGSSNTTGATFSWSPIGINTATAQVTAAGNYTLTVTDPTNGCINSATTTVIASGAFPNISISPTGTLSCLNTSITLTGSSTTSAASFSWAPQGVNTPSALATTAGNYTFMVTDPLNGCTSTSVITITQNTTSPILNINPSTTLTCLNPIATLSATSAGNTIVWNGGSLTNATNPATINLAGTYSATATNPVNGCVDTQIITVNQNTTVPTLNITASATNLNCNMSSVTLTGSSNVNAGVYLWSTNVLGANNLPGAIANNAGTYSLTVTDPLNGCFNTATVGVSSAPMFSASVVVLSQINCFGNNNGALQIGVVSGGTAPFSITNLNSGSSINNIASFPIVLSNLSAANYSILVSDANGCNQTLFATITQPAALNLALGGNSTLCEGQSTTISSNVSGGSAPYAYVWSPTGGNGANLNTGTTISTNTTFSLLLTDNNGCQAQASIAIVVNPKPNATLINNKLTGCSPVCAGFSLSAIQQAGYQYSWQFTNNQSGSVTSSQLYEPDLCFKEEGSYNAGVVISSSAGCSTTVTYNNLIQVYQKPDADFSFSPTSVTMLEPLVSFTNSSSGASVYGWYNSNINSLFSNQANPTYVFQEPGNYLIALVATNGSCSDTALKLIEVEEEFLFYAPNAFTPNEDNLNDTWYPLVTGYKEGSFNLLLFDRWGEQLYQSNDPTSKGWDGFYKKQLCKDDVYIWKATVKDRKGKLHQFMGYVSLLK